MQAGSRSVGSACAQPFVGDRRPQAKYTCLGWAVPRGDGQGNRGGPTAAGVKGQSGRCPALEMDPPCLQFSQLLQAPGGRLAGAVFPRQRACLLPFHWAELRWHGSFLIRQDPLPLTPTPRISESPTDTPVHRHHPPPLACLFSEGHYGPVGWGMKHTAASDLSGGFTYEMVHGILPEAWSVA